jgi:hypothetical protein
LPQDFSLGKQVGPLPLGAWLAIVAGGLGLGYYINKRQGERGPEPQLLAESGVGTGAGQMIYEPPQTGTTPVVEESNLSWGRKATDWLVSTGLDPYNADQAIRKYLISEQLTVAERAMVNLAITRFGAPPEALPPAPPTPAPTPPPTPAPAPAPVTYAIAWTKVPRIVGHKPFTLTGRLLANGKPAILKVVRIEAYRSTWGMWKFSAYLGTNSLGYFTYTHPGLGSNAYFRATHAGKYTASYLARVK